MDDGDMDMDMDGGMGEETSSRQASATSRTLSRQSNRPGELIIILIVILGNMKTIKLRTKTAVQIRFLSKLS